MEKCEINANDIKNLDSRVSKLEKFRESDNMILADNNKNLAVIVEKLEHITSSMETLTNNFKEAMNRSNDRQREREENTNKRITILEKQVSQIIDKHENDASNLEKELNERTIIKNSNSWDKLKWLIIAESIGLVVLIIKLFLKI